MCFVSIGRKGVRTHTRPTQFQIVGMEMALCMVLLGPVLPALGARAEADQSTRGQSFDAGGAKTINVWAHSNDTAAGMKNVTTTTTIPAAVAVPAVNGLKTITVGAGLIKAGKAYVSSYGANGVAKPKATDRPDLYRVRSESGPAVGSAFSSPTTVLAVASVTKGMAGEAAGEAVDPIHVSPGAYAYTPQFGYLSLEASDASEYAALQLSASDTSSSTPLWTMVIIADGALNSASDLDIKFTYDSTRLALGSGLSESVIQDNLRSSFTVGGGIATYGDPTLSGAGLTDTAAPPWDLSTIPALFTATYTVDGANGVEYGDASAAIASSTVPEPCSLLLLVAAAAFRTRRRIP